MSNLLMLGVGSTATALTFSMSQFTSQDNGSLLQTSSDTIPYGIDFTALLSSGDVVSNPVVTVYSINGAAGYLTSTTYVSNVGVIGNILHLTLANLTPALLIRIQVTVTLAAGKVVSAWFTVFCPF